MTQFKTSTSFHILFERSKYLRGHSTALLREARDLCSASERLRNSIPMVAHQAGLMTSRAAFPNRIDRTTDSLSPVEIDPGGAGSDVDDCDYFQLADIDYLDGACF